MSKHTATPWQVNSSVTTQVCDTDGEVRGCAPIAECNTGSTAERVANAKFIALACNAHDELVNAAKVALQYLEAVSFNSAGSKKSRNYAEAASIVRDALKEAGAL